MGWQLLNFPKSSNDGLQNHQLSKYVVLVQKSPFNDQKTAKTAQIRQLAGSQLIIRPFESKQRLLRKIRISERLYALSVLTVPRPAYTACNKGSFTS